jgi:hypothetical protein
MQRKLILAFLLLSSVCLGQLSEVTACTAVGTTSCTFSSALTYVDFGYTIIVFADNTGTTNVTIATGYTCQSSRTAGTIRARFCWKHSSGNETGSGTWTNATQTFAWVLSGGDIQAAGPIGTIGTINSGTSTTIAYNTITLTRTNTTSWVLGCAVAVTATAADVAPAGMVLRSGTGPTNFACSDTNGAVNSWPTTNVTGINGTSTAWASAIVEIFAAPAAGTVSGHVVHPIHYGFTSEACTGACDLTLPIPASLTNNLLLVAWSWQYTGTAPTVSNVYCNSDTGHATWTFTSGGFNALNTTDLVDTFIYYVAGATAGCTSVTVVPSTTWTFAEADVLELRQMATSSPVDTGAGQFLTLGTAFMTAGSFTPGTSGDFIYQKCLGSGNGIGSAAATNTFQPSGVTQLSTDNRWAIGSQGFVQTTAAAITPYMQLAGIAGDGNCVALALKTSAGAGTAPSGVYVVQQQDYFGNAATTSYQFHFFNTADTLLFLGINTLNGNQWTSVSDLIGNSGTTHQTSGGGSGYPAWWVACDATSGDDVLTVSGASASNSGNYVLVEWAGLKNSSSTACYDSTAGLATGTTSATPYSIPTLTPSTTGGVALAMINEGTGPVLGISAPAGAVYSYPSYTGMTDASTMTEGGGFSMFLSPSASSHTWTWSLSSSSAVASAIALEAQPAGARSCVMTGEPICLQAK